MNLAVILPWIWWVWLGTFVVSFTIQIKSVLNLLEEAANQGYKLNIERMREFGQMISNDENEKKMILSLFIPLYNLAIAKELNEHYKNFADEMINEFLIIGILEEMSDEEQNEYSKNPKGQTSLDISIKTKFEKEDKIVQNVEKRLQGLLNDSTLDRTSTIEELKKIKEEIKDLSINNTFKYKLFVKSLNDAELYLNGITDEEFLEEKEDGPKLKKKM